MDSPNGNNNPNQFLQSKPGSNFLNYSYSILYTYAILHTHFDNMNDPMISPGDLIQFNDWLVRAKAWNDNPANLQKVNLKNISYTLVTRQGSYMLIFDGTNVTPFSGYNIDDLDKKYEEEVLKPATTVGNMSGEVNYNMDKMEEEFLLFAKKYLPIPGMKLFRIADAVVNFENTEIFLDNTNSRDTNTCN